MPVTSIEPVANLAELQVGDHVSWDGRSSPLLVVKITRQAPPSATFDDELIAEIEVTLRTKTGSECIATHWSQGETDIRVKPYTRYNWISGLRRLIPIDDATTSRRRGSEATSTREVHA